jgi:hypothetical protein
VAARSDIRRLVDADITALGARFMAPEEGA